MTGESRLADIFVPEPQHWGLRGDPHVWREFRARLEHVQPPSSADELIALLHNTFEDAVGVRVTAADAPDSVHRPEFAHGGMSSGMVSLVTWRNELMPVLEGRARHLLSGRPGTAAIILVRGDITEQWVDAIVNAANSSLLGGGGVDGAIHRAGGPEILDACRALRASHYGKGLRTGQAVATTGGRLHARSVIHTVGPVWSATEDRSALLASCYRESLRVADQLDANTVAFPAISTGIYGWPLDDGARIAIDTVRNTETAVREARFVLFDDRAYESFAAALRAGEAN